MFAIRSGACASKSVLRRTIASSVAKLNAAQDLTHVVVEEKKDISSMDQLLRVVSESARQFLLQSLCKPSCYRERIQSCTLQVTQTLVYMRLYFSLPSYSSAMPMRSQIPWSEALLNSASKTEPPETQSTAPLAPNLVPRRMQDSYTELTLPFGSSSQLLEQYTNASGGIRTGKSVPNLFSEI